MIAPFELYGCGFPGSVTCAAFMWSVIRNVASVGTRVIGARSALHLEILSHYKLNLCLWLAVCASNTM